MPRISKAHKAGLDLVDQIAFNELVVYQGMTDIERQQLGTIISRVTEMAESKYQGREAEIIKHSAFALLAIALSNTGEEIRNAIALDFPPLDLPKQTIDQIHSHIRTVQMATMLVSTEKWIGFDGSYACEIVDSLQNEFTDYSALVRRDLVMRCFVMEFAEASVKTYCWLTVCGVLPVTKNDPTRIKGDLDKTIALRLALMCDYEMIIQFLKASASETSGTEVLARKHKKLDLKESTLDRLLDVQNVFQRSWSRSSLRNTIPLICEDDLMNTERMGKFFDMWGARKARFRTHPGNLASWLSFLGATMVEMHLPVERIKQEVENKRAAAANENAKRVMRSVFNAADNAGTITERVQNHLLKEYGLQINADTLYRGHAMLCKSTLYLLQFHCEIARGAGVAFSPVQDDPFYLSAFVHSDKLPSKKA
ncbi:hypothetical protein QAO71_17390 (plasmid) [Halopseudomonas sp. SMJS2]|uniref:hypothetical protein n=1 Tax=Halopseudomonas sp. SMJS2 TaxID=3041098 RepID=UPI002452D1E9|nr:hypothetical protein [Halopseudomonas sp. SMJS2]WGK63543.1 hypothetical protein QAO71_17390 [Halopseudomonas sp. SMJS2]